MRRVTMLATGAVLAGLALAGCGERQAASQNDGHGETLQILADRLGASSSGKQSVHLVMSMDMGTQAIKADGDMQVGAAPVMDLTYDFAGVGKARMLLVDDIIYIELPKQAQTKTGGKPWVKIDTNGDDPVSKSLGGALEEAKTNGDPSQIIKRVEKAGEITAKKQEDLNGKPTTHYSVTVDIKKYAATVNPELKKTLDKAIEAGVNNYPLEVWVDQDDLPVRVTSESPFTNPLTQKSEHLKLAIDYSDWGKPVSVTAPPADQVGTLPGR
jgi:hypothetical protein